MEVRLRQAGVEQVRGSRLRATRAVATGMLAAAAGVFVLTLAVEHPGDGVLLLRAVAEAALVGGLADWFAVTALFRHPLGLPIPHTAILPANKDRIGEGLAHFLDRHFLTSEVLLPELRSLHPADRMAAWLARRSNAALIAAETAKALPHFLAALDDRQIRAFLAQAVGSQLRNAPIAPLLGESVRVLTAAGYHEAVLDSALDYARDFLARSEDRLLEAVSERRRQWLPRAVNREIARAMLRAAAELIEDLRQPDGAARRTLLQKIDEFATNLATEPGFAALDRSPRAVMNRPEVRAWIAATWERLRKLALRDLETPESRIELALTLMIASFGESLRSDPGMRARLDATLEAVVVEALPWRPELVRFVTEVVRQWQPRDFSDRVEAVVGADLQYIRMNGTIVGGLVGGALYLLSLLAR